MAELVYADAHTAVSGHAAGNDTTAVALLVLHDHNANVVGLADADGNIAAQYSWSPYGELRAVEYDPSSLTSAEAVSAAKGNRLGHQGLRMERFDRPWDGALDLSTVVASGTNATGEYRAIANCRNRMYDPGVGRFLEVDPNGVALPVSAASSFGGQELVLAVLGGDVRQHFADGMNCHAAYGSQPQRQRDPQGLNGQLLWLYANTARVTISAMQAAEMRIGMLVVQHYTKLVIAAEVAAGMAIPDGSPSPYGAAGLEVAQVVRSMNRGPTGELLEFAAHNFRPNSLKIWGAEGTALASTLQAHHIIPQWNKVVEIMNRLGIGSMVHNPLFSSLETQASHALMHAGGANGGAYNQEWFRFLTRLENQGIRGDAAARAVIDFIINDIVPRFGPNGWG